MPQQFKSVALALLKGLYAGCRRLPMPLPLRRTGSRVFDRAYHYALPSVPYLVRSNGHAMFVNPLDRDISRQITLRGDYEPGKKRAFLGCLKKGMTVLDIGANMGDYTLVAARTVGGEGAVYAFEPDPVNFALLLKNVSLGGYKNVTCVRKALSNSPGLCNLYLDKHNLGCHSLCSANTYTPASSANAETDTIDSFVSSLPGRRVDFLKIDAQGAEGLILEGAADTLARHNITIFAEFWPWGLLNMGTDPGAFLDKLKLLGYEIRLIPDDGPPSALPEDFHTLCGSSCDRGYHVDLLFSKP
jgi:FkbM family methyltransferase